MSTLGGSCLPRARLAGVFYLFNILTILLAVVCFRGIVVPRDPVATARNLTLHESLVNVGITLELMSTVCSVVVAALLYELLKPVDGTIALLAAFFRVMACAVAVSGYGFQLAPLPLLEDSRSWHSFRPDEAATMALMVYRLHSPVSSFVIVLFGFHFLLLGYLILKSTFLPRALGIVAGTVGVVGLLFLVPWLARTALPYLAPVGLLVEVSLTFWLLTARVDVEKWTHQRAASFGA